MADHPIVSRKEWNEARKRLLQEEKAFTRARDALSAQRRALPWVQVDTSYTFQTTRGQRTLADLFDGRGQLVVYHFMFGPDWPEGCATCSFWADNFDGIDVHLAHRDTTLVAVSRAPLETIQAYRKRMGWRFEWVSSHGSSFNRDFQVCFTPEEVKSGTACYNYANRGFPSTEAPGMSAFRKLEDGRVFHTYSTFGRGLDLINGAYHILDLTSKGRDEDELPHTMAWLRRRDRYEDPR